MKNFFLISVLLFVFLGGVFGREYDTVVVTDVNYLNRTIAMYPEDAFPICFEENCKNVKMLFSQVEELCKQRFGAKNVKFTSGQINYKYGMFRQIPDFSDKQSRNDGKLFVAIEMILQMRTQWGTHRNFNLITRVTVQDVEGNQVYFAKNKIPFEIKESEKITGELLLSQTQLTTLFQRGIKYAFDDPSKKSAVISFVPPEIGYQHDFLAISTRHYLVKHRKKYDFGDRPEKTKTALKIRSNFIRSFDGGFNIGSIFHRDKVRNSYTIANNYSNKSYVQKIIGKSNTILNSVTFTGDINIELQNGKDKPDSLIFFHDYRLNGKIGENKYQMIYQPGIKVLELYRNDSLFAIVKYVQNYSVVYITPSAPPDFTGDMLDLVCAYDHSAQALQEMEAKAGEEDD